MPAPHFTISSYCNHGGCVAVAALSDDTIAVQNTTTPGRSVTFSAADWDAFVAGVKNGEFDRAALPPG